MIIMRTRSRPPAGINITDRLNLNSPTPPCSTASERVSVRIQRVKLSLSAVLTGIGRLHGTATRSATHASHPPDSYAAPQRARNARPMVRNGDAPDAASAGSGLFHVRGGAYHPGLIRNNRSDDHARCGRARQLYRRRLRLADGELREHSPGGLCDGPVDAR